MSAKMYAVPSMQLDMYQCLVWPPLNDQPNSVLASSVVIMSPLFMTVTLAIYNAAEKQFVAHV
jgi:hypothetical protein